MPKRGRKWSHSGLLLFYRVSFLELSLYSLILNSMCCWIGWFLNSWHLNNFVCIFVGSPLPVDPELDWRQTGGRPVREGQCQRHWQSSQHLSALRCRSRHEELCGGQRNCVDQRICIRILCFAFFPLSVQQSCVIQSAKIFSASEVCLTTVFASRTSALCFILSEPSSASSSVCQDFHVFEKISSSLICAAGGKITSR